MGDEQAISDFPDEQQRAAVAYSTYRDEEMEEMELGGVSILEVGEAKGHDLFVDKTSLETALKLMSNAKNGVKVKMNHGSGLDAVVGFARNPRIDGDKLVADLRLLRNSPHYGLIKEMASEAPDQFGVSLAFVNESETINGKDYIRPQSIASADLVSSPAATNGLFEEMVKFMEKIKNLNCGTGSGGFQPGNKCAGGGDGGEESSSSKSPLKAQAKISSQKILKSSKEYKTRIEKSLLKKSIFPEDSEYKSVMRTTNKDVADLEDVADYVKSGDYSAAASKLDKMDTYAKDQIPQSVYNEIYKYSKSKSFENIDASEQEKLGYVQGGKTIPAVAKESVEEAPLDKKDKTNMENNYSKDIEDIKVRLAAIEDSMKPKEEVKKEEMASEKPSETPAPAPEISVEVEPSEDKKEEMSEVVKKVLTEFGIKPISASPIVEAPAKVEPKTFEALVAAHSDYGTSKLKAMQAVMLSNPKEYSEALSRGITKL
jgi:hypothetical protein